MGVVEDFKRTIKELQRSINPAIQKSIEGNKDDLIDQITQGQLDKGQDSEGLQIVPSYALSTIEIKRSKGQPTNRVTLKDTGDLYESISIEANTTQAIITANVEYFKYLVVHYDQNQILGINPEFLEGFVEEVVLEEIENAFNDIIG